VDSACDVLSIKPGPFRNLSSWLWVNNIVFPIGRIIVNHRSVSGVNFVDICKCGNSREIVLFDNVIGIAIGC
jgi:hypothetical protein